MNIVVINGNLTKDIELKQTSNGKSFCKFSIACRRTKDITDFINCVAWEGSAEALLKYASKGQKLCVQGELTQQSYESNGHKVNTYEVLVNKFDLPNKEPMQKVTERVEELFPDDVRLPF